MANVNNKGIYQIQEWIEKNQNYNSKVFTLSAKGIALEINQCANLDDDIKRNGEFVYEVGLRDARGYVMTISLDENHFNIN